MFLQLPEHYHYINTCVVKNTGRRENVVLLTELNFSHVSDLLHEKLLKIIIPRLNILVPSMTFKEKYEKYLSCTESFCESKLLTFS